MHEFSASTLVCENAFWEQSHVPGKGGAAMARHEAQAKEEEILLHFDTSEAATHGAADHRCSYKI